MDQKILKLATKKLKILAQRYPGFINVVVDDWRGYKFVFDTEDVRRCKNDCANCPLFRLLEKEKIVDGFFPGPYPASPQDKALFGPEHQLNCKTLEQYLDCYVNFLVKEANSKKEIEDELDLILNLSLIFSEKKPCKQAEFEFKNSIIEKALRRSSPWKKCLIRNHLKTKRVFYESRSL